MVDFGSGRIPSERPTVLLRKEAAFLFPHSEWTSLGIVLCWLRIAVAIRRSPTNGPSPFRVSGSGTISSACTAKCECRDVTHSGNPARTLRELAAPHRAPCSAQVKFLRLSCLCQKGVNQSIKPRNPSGERELLIGEPLCNHLLGLSLPAQWSANEPGSHFFSFLLLVRLALRSPRPGDGSRSSSTGYVNSVR